MHRILPTERAERNAPGHYCPETPRNIRIEEPDQTAHQRNLPAASAGASGRVGRRAQPAAGGGDGLLPCPGTGTVTAFSSRAAGCIVHYAKFALRLFLLGLIRFYQVCLSPTIPSSCRFYPSCSAYAYEAVAKWGPWRGTRLAVRRLLSCRPWGGHGYDPVP